MTEFSDKMASEFCLPGEAQMDMAWGLSADRTRICEPYSLEEELDDLREQSQRLKEANNIYGETASLVRLRIAQIYKRPSLSYRDRVNLAGVASLLNPPGDVNAH